MTPDGWHKIARRLFESADGQWRITNPWRTTELRHRWLVAERRVSGTDWCVHDGNHATLHDACAYVNTDNWREVAGLRVPGTAPRNTRVAHAQRDAVRGLTRHEHRRH